MIPTQSNDKKCKDMLQNKAFTYEECHTHKRDKGAMMHMHDF